MRDDTAIRRCLIVLICFSTFSCGPSYNGYEKQDGGPYVDRRMFDEYVRKYYPTDLVVVGGLIGAALGCVVARSCVQGAVYGTLIGVSVSATAGYVVAAQAARYKLEEDRLSALKSAAEREYYEAREAREISERLVASRREEIKVLRRKLRQGAISTREYAFRLTSILDDAEKIAIARNGLENQVQALSLELQTLRHDSSDLYREKERLGGELISLDRQVKLLGGDFDDLAAL